MIQNLNKSPKPTKDDSMSSSSYVDNLSSTFHWRLQATINICQLVHGHRTRALLLFPGSQYPRRDHPDQTIVGEVTFRLLGLYSTHASPEKIVCSEWQQLKALLSSTIPKKKKISSAMSRMKGSNERIYSWIDFSRSTYEVNMNPRQLTIAKPPTV
ncbi:hypothetical protein CEXT_789951 [Caerostris extrusa]|uniref:Uncharacterized protein n=1 Tax=Caerostris extrusa TaxID=172846 RepID=A0AAV4M3D2_CAEEX|nr:hypothetical protein CEXT_789951 [Caerostris extrusa]